MHADIGEPDDAPAMARFREALAALDARLEGREWAIGVDLWRYRIGSETFSVFADSWSVDIEGPPELVRRVVAAVQQGHAGPPTAPSDSTNT